MAVSPSTIPTTSVEFGGKPEDRIIAGDSYDRTLLFTDVSVTPNVPIDFTGWTQSGEFIDEDGSVIAGTSVTVTPDPGDATGTIRIQVTAAVTTILLGSGDGKSRLALRGTFGAERKTWICGNFTVEAC